jgi:hypothetical protein
MTPYEFSALVVPRGDPADRPRPASGTHQRRATATAEARLHELAHEHRHQDESDSAVTLTGAPHHRSLYERRLVL